MLCASLVWDVLCESIRRICGSDDIENNAMLHHLRGRLFRKTKRNNIETISDSEYITTTKF